MGSTKLEIPVQHALPVVLKPTKLPTVHPIQIVSVQTVLLAVLENVKLHLVQLHQIVNVPTVRRTIINRPIHLQELPVYHGQNAQLANMEVYLRLF